MKRAVHIHVCPRGFVANDDNTFSNARGPWTYVGAGYLADDDNEVTLHAVALPQSHLCDIKITIEDVA